MTQRPDLPVAVGTWRSVYSLMAKGIIMTFVFAQLIKLAPV